MPSQAGLDDEEHGRGYSVGVAAMLLGRDTKDVVGYFKQGRVHRWEHRISHAHKNPSYFYSRSDIDALVQEVGRPFVLRKLVDLTKRYVRAIDAARLLGVSTKTVYDLGARNTGCRIRTLPSCRFKFPAKTVATGYLLDDIVALKRRREKTELVATFVEETVEKSTVKKRLKMDLAMVQPSDLFAANARGELTAEETIDRLRDLLLQAA